MGCFGKFCFKSFLRFEGVLTKKCLDTRDSIVLLQQHFYQLEGKDHKSYVKKPLLNLLLRRSTLKEDVFAGRKFCVRKL